MKWHANRWSARVSWCHQVGCPGRRRCRACRNVASSSRRKTYRELSDEARLKANCRAYTKVLQARGHLPKGPCEGCGASDAQNHHPNYRSPRWFYRFCRVCHAYASPGVVSDPVNTHAVAWDQVFARQDAKNAVHI